MTLARIISYISNPIFIFVFLPYFLVYKTTRSEAAAWYWTIITSYFLLTFVLFVFIGVKKKFFSDIDVSNREQRPVLYLMGAVLTILYLFTLFILHGPQILFITILGIILGILLASIINMKIKASVHVAAISGLLTSFGIIYRGYFLLLLLLIPVIGWSRVKIRRHTVTEVIIGAILGSLLTLIMYFVTKSFYL